MWPLTVSQVRLAALRYVSKKVILTWQAWLLQAVYMSNRRQMAMANTETTIQPHELTREESLAMLDRRARRYLGISGEEFVRRWEAGYYEGQPESPGLVRTAMLLPLVS